MTITTGNINSLMAVQNHASKETKEELQGACKEFEAYFLEQMMKAMWKTVPESGSESAASGTLKEYYREEMFRELASESVQGEGLGLAQMLYEQMKRNEGI